VLTDPPWMASAVSIARKYAAPIVPIHVAGPWSTLFHLFDRVSRELRDITLFHELLNKKGRRFSLTIGRPIDPEALPGDAGEATETLKRFVESMLPNDPESSPT
jgi:putative hemolysin